MRVRLDFAYDGTDFSGWAAQPGLRTVEGELTEAVERVTRTQSLKLTVAGRTDAGVHARGSVCHVDLDHSVVAALPGRSDREPMAALVTRLNGVLSPDVVVRSTEIVPDTFDARFSATFRRYSYRICDDAAALDPLRRRDTIVVKRHLDVESMNVAASLMLGLRDFAAYCKKREGATTIRTLLEYDWARDETGIITGHVMADAFCHSMVRALVGSVIPVGEGRRPIEWPSQVLDAGLRDPAVVVMPAHGLCLEEVGYPDASQYAARDAESRLMRSL